MDEEEREKERKRLIDRLVSNRYLSKPEVIEAMLEVPRHGFVPESKRCSAYVDMPLTIGHGQTISAPHMVAMMTEHLDVKPYHRVLEIGAGSGYQAAVIAEILKEGELYTLERIPELAKNAEKNLRDCGYSGVHVIVGEGTKGYAEKAPYDRIIVTAGAPRVPKALLEQLGEKGKLLIPVGGRMLQELMLIEKTERGFKEKRLGGCVFVPLIGEDGW
jgi:protein-L-isoaspartate(D-aspartate) O-methyltransferase